MVKVIILAGGCHLGEVAFKMPLGHCADFCFQVILPDYFNRLAHNGFEVHEN